MEKVSTTQLNFSLYNMIQSNQLDAMSDVIFNNIIDQDTIKFKNDTLKNNKSLISLILQFAILTNNDKIIDNIKPYISMKRDYYNLMNYKNNKLDCTNIFLESILPKNDITSQDIEFLINNNYYYLLPYLQHKYIHINLDGSFPVIKLDKIKMQNKKYYLDQIKEKISSRNFDMFNKFLTKKNFNYIIDAGNVLFSRNGILTDKSIQDLDKVINSFENSLIIIHKRHLKNPQIRHLLHQKNFYETPYNMNDDIFIIMAFIIFEVPIITNDNYKDHYINDDYLRGHILDNLIKYENNKGNIEFIRENSVSSCVHVIDSSVYIPANNGFIEIKYN